ncbi:MAG: orotidine 5'-phosphate decarboxylase / HUMPS family protein [Thermoprotei archaeon]|nr:orotidine 5'-phosphate decarboxylase / HUMPS family protein [TACK group archaeon]
MYNDRWPVLQVALDLVSADRALEIASQASEAGAQWLEAGSPLIMSEGVGVVRRLKTSFPDKVVVADLKLLEQGYVLAEMASANGADVITVSALSSRRNVSEAIEGAKKNGAKVMIDLLWVRRSEELDRAKTAVQLGADYVCFHMGSDDIPFAPDSLAGRQKDIESAISAISVPVAVAGRLNDSSAAEMAKAGAKIIAVGAYITGSANVRQATTQLLKSIGAPQGRKA